MVPVTTPKAPPAAPGSLAVTIVLVAAITALRAAVLALSDFDLYGDEAQYWSWAQAPAFGYFSKPPMVAWIILGATSLCRDGETCVRIASPLFHAATSLVIFALARDLYDERVGAWSAVTYATLPAVSVSSQIVSTDVPLLLFWAVATFAFARLLRTMRYGWALATGVALGLGLLSKYAMAYFLPCAVLYCVTTPQARPLLTSRAALVVLATAGVLVAPNVLWNVDNGLATYSHTLENAHWVGSMFHPDKAMQFVGSQFGVFGPILFGALLARTAAWRLSPPSSADRLLLYFSLPVIALVAAESLMSRAHANWAAPAYVAATILVVAWLMQSGRNAWLKSSLGLHVLAGLALYVVAVTPLEARLPPKLDPFVHLRGWNLLAGEVEKLLEEQPGGVVLCDDRMVMAELIYYLRFRPATIRMWNPDSVPDNHYDLTASFTAQKGTRVFFLTGFANPRRVLERFVSARLRETLSVPSATRSRTFYIYELET